MQPVFVRIDSSWYERPPGMRERQGAGGVVVRLEGEHVLVALIRGDGLPDYLIPKGGVEQGESPEQAARREVEEEAGLTQLELLDDLGARERLSYTRERWQVTRYFLFATRQVEGRPTDLTHAYSVDWFPIDSLPTMFWPEQERLIVENRAWILKCVHKGS